MMISEFNLVMPQTFYIRSRVLALGHTIPRILPIDNEYKKILLAICLGYWFIFEIPYERACLNVW